jgi:hypothetical protein
VSEAADRALAIGLMPEGTRTARGVSEMAFHKKCGLRIEDVVRSRWVYRNLRNSTPVCGRVGCVPHHQLRSPRRDRRRRSLPANSWAWSCRVCALAA